MRLVVVLLSIVGVAAAVRLPAATTLRPQLSRTPLVRCTASDGEAAASQLPEEGLVTYASLDEDYKTLIDGALMNRNKVRIMEGKPKYNDVAAMVDAYYEFEGAEKGMSKEACENEVIRYLQRAALMDEGGFDIKDPQTIVTFGLLIFLVIGVIKGAIDGKVAFN